MLINKTGLLDLTTHSYRVYVNDTNGNSNNTGLYVLNTNEFGLIVDVSTGVNFTFRPFVENATLRTENISCSGQNESVGCINFSNFGSNTLNVSLLFNISNDPVNQRIIEDFSIGGSNNTRNRTIVNISVACGEIQSLNLSGFIEYRYNNTVEVTYKNLSNISNLINVSVNCTGSNYYTRILNGTQMNITGFDALNLTWKGDNTSNTFDVTLFDEGGINSVTSTALTLSNPNANSSGILLGALKNISMINISVINVSGTHGLSGFFLDTIRLTNITSNQSDRIRMKVSCTGHYQNATLLPIATSTPMCVLAPSVVTKYVWLYQDINLTEKGVEWALNYGASIVS